MVAPSKKQGNRKWYNNAPGRFNIWSPCGHESEQRLNWKSMPHNNFSCRPRVASVQANNTIDCAWNVNTKCCDSITDQLDVSIAPSARKQWNGGDSMMGKRRWRKRRGGKRPRRELQKTALRGGGNNGGGPQGSPLALGHHWGVGGNGTEG